MTRMCAECQSEPVSGRRLYCEECGRLRRNAQQLERDRAARERGSRAEDFGPADEIDREVIDVTAPGYASKPPSHDVLLKPARPPAFAGDVVDYSKGGDHRPSIYQRPEAAEVNRLPNWVRRDAERARRTVAEQNRAAQQGPLSWDGSLAAMQERVHNDATMVDFTRKPYPMPRVNALGQSIPRDRGLLR